MSEPMSDPTTSDRLKRYGIPAALLVGGMAVGSLFAPIGLASAQESDGAESDATTDTDTDTGETDGAKSLAEIAESLEVDDEAVRAALSSAAETHLDAAVEAGRLSQEEADEKLAEMTERLDDKINEVRGEGEGVGRQRGHRKHHRSHRAEMSEFLGLSGADIHEGLAEGKNIAELAAEQGISEDELVDHIVSNIETHMNEAVEAGKIEADDAAQKLEQVEEHVTDMVNGELPTFDGKRGMRNHADRFHKSADGA